MIIGRRARARRVPGYGGRPVQALKVPGRHRRLPFPVGRRWGGARPRGLARLPPAGAEADGQV